MKKEPTKMTLKYDESAIIFKSDGTMAMVLPNAENFEDDIAPASMVAASKVMMGLREKRIWKSIDKIFEKHVAGMFEEKTDEKLPCCSRAEENL